MCTKKVAPLNPLHGAAFHPFTLLEELSHRGDVGWGGVGGEAHGKPLPTIGTKSSIPSAQPHHHPPSTSMDCSSVYANITSTLMTAYTHGYVTQTGMERTISNNK